MADVTEVMVYITDEVAKNAHVQAHQAARTVYPTPKRDRLKEIIETCELGEVLYEFFTLTNLTEVDVLDDLLTMSSMMLRVRDADHTVRRLEEVTNGTDFEGVLRLVVGETYSDPDDPNCQRKNIEVYYDIDAIPPAFADPLAFRNGAMDIVETALREAGAGEWEGAEIGMGEVSFGFTVDDFDQAEGVLRAAVKGTPFEGIREISRYEGP